MLLLDFNCQKYGCLKKDKIMINILQYIYNNVFLYITIVVLLAIMFSVIHHYKYVSDNRFMHNEKPNTGINKRVCMLIITLVIIVIWYWIIYMPLGFGHKDEVVYLFDHIQPQIFSGRFFPLGHIEFNFLSLKLTHGNLAPLYLLPLVELILFIFFLVKLVNTNNILINAYVVIISSLYYMVSVTGLIIPERNLILLFIIGIYFLKKYYIDKKLIYLICSILPISLSLYYKEPIFLTYFSIAVVFILYKIFLYNTGLKNIKERILASISPIELGIFISVLFFIVGYLFYVYYGGKPSTYYVKVGYSYQQYLERLYFYLLDVPIITSLLLISALGHLLIEDKYFDKLLIVAVSIGGISYTLELVVLGLPLNGYYFSIPLISLALSSAILSKYIIRHHLTKIKYLLLYMAFFGVVSVLIGVYPIIYRDLMAKKNYQTQYNFLAKSLNHAKNMKSLYYGIKKNTDYRDYHTAVLMIFINKSNIAQEFTIYSDSGCAVWNESYNGGLIRCVKKDYSNSDDYDVLVIEDDDIVVKNPSDYESFGYVSQLKLDGRLVKKIDVLINKRDIK